MDYTTYKKFRAYCWQDLSPYLNAEGQIGIMRLWTKIHGPVGQLQREQMQAESLFHCTDITPRELSAAHLLAVISNHRAIAWQRERKTPDGRPPAEPLTATEDAALWNQTRAAVKEYAAFLSEREAAAMLGECERAASELSEPQAETTAPEATIGKRWTAEKLAELKAYREKHTMPQTAVMFGISEQRIRQLLPSEKRKLKGYSAFTQSQK